MGSCEDPVSRQNTHDQIELGLMYPKPDPDPDPDAELLVQQFENVALKDTEETEIQYPLRPYAQDCPYYVRTGSCKFGLNCKFNHPVTRTGQVGKERENEGEGLSEKIECKYYLTGGGCKYGNSCRYSHSKETNELATLEYNFLGLPMRVGEKECPYYMRTGSCGYGANCRFHHPDPTSVGGSEPNGNGESVGGFDSLGNHNGESTILNLSGASQPSMASWSSHMLSNREFPTQIIAHLMCLQCIQLLKEYIQILNLMGIRYISLSQIHPEFEIGMHIISAHSSLKGCLGFVWNQLDFLCPENLTDVTVKILTEKLDIPCPPRVLVPCAPIHSQGMPRHLHSGLTLNKLMKKSDVSQHYEQTQVEEFPERPGKPECDYFMKTGDCKYKSACRYHHPKSRVPGLPVCALSDKGLPLRPGKKFCWHYESYGICKYGRACLFDHPPNHTPSSFPVGSKLDPPLGHNSATVGGNRMAGCQDEIQASGWD
ncbi:Zinc finger CCCH domain-containing protein 67 [Vitis vinifera]|uniref:Zinc finger CCCH domain-containing protein 67 n=1 Tax=Vitis vinifera TaxID=29760 RepID=A0A438G9Y0_VITVI|nr:Zinc finger CCCH domain-containing protein 67 [Vitis vinifera]